MSIYRTEEQAVLLPMTQIYGCLFFITNLEDEKLQVYFLQPLKLLAFQYRIHQKYSNLPLTYHLHELCDFSHLVLNLILTNMTI